MDPKRNKILHGFSQNQMYNFTLSVKTPDVASERHEPQVLKSKSHSHFVDQISHV